MSINATARSTLAIGNAPANPGGREVALTAYQGFAYTPVANIENLGGWGSEANVLTGNFVDQRFTRKLKGQRDNGDLELVCAFDATDPGQIALKAGEQTDYAYPFEIVLPDAPPGGTGTTFYFYALVTSARIQADDTETITKINFKLAIDGAIIEVPAKPNVTITPAAGALTAGQAGQPYAANIAAAGGVGTVTYAVIDGALPAGLTINVATGQITGSPTAAGSNAFTVKATYSGSGDVSAAYTLEVAA